MSSHHDPDKLAIARKLLLREGGATIAEIAKATKRSVRAVRRWMTLLNDEKGSKYRVTRTGPGAYLLWAKPPSRNASRSDARAGASYLRHTHLAPRGRRA